MEALKKLLNTFYSKTGNERVGFIIGENKIVEVKNISNKPEESFLISGEDIVLHIETEGCWATWHTHPNDTCNLSGEDYRMFSGWKDFTHFIIGKDGVKAYKYNQEKKALLEV